MGWSDMAMRNMGSRLSCFAHSLRLVVRDSTLEVVRLAMAKCSNLANTVHQSGVFRSAFENELGIGRSIPAINDNRWNSTNRQLKAIIELDPAKLAKVLRECQHDNLVQQTKELNQLQELVSTSGAVCR